MGQWRLAEAQGIKLLNITAKNGIQAFAPDYSLVMDYKSGKVSEEEYSEIYLAKMVRSKEEFKLYWDTLAKYPRMALACYCAPNTFCHRHLFLNLVIEHLKALGIEAVYKGELRRA